MSDTKVALITGAAHRIGARLAQRCHQAGYKVVLHYHRSATAAAELCAGLNRQRPNSALCLAADLANENSLQALADDIGRHCQRLDLLVNNASQFAPSPLGQTAPALWHALVDSNLKGPYFLIQACLPLLRASGGNIVNLIDMHARRPLPGYAVYCISKAGLQALTEALALDLAPTVRVNGVAPGAILWPHGSAALTPSEQQQLLAEIPLDRLGEPDDIANAVLFLADQAPYITGQIITVDGGRSLSPAAAATTTG